MLPESEKTAATRRLPVPKPGNEVFITGIAGRFPESDNLTSLKENLFNKRDLITDDDRRWKPNLDIPRRSGKVNNIDKFDSQFFGVNFEDAQTMDPMGRMLLEHAYEAVVDAGVNPSQLHGTNTGVFIGTNFSDSEQTLIYGKNQMRGSGVKGCSRSMLANRISHWLKISGPSYNVDAACSSSLCAIDHAYRAITSGECEAAIVGVSQLCLNPLMTLQFWKLGTLSTEGCCKSFDADANGYCRSEAICVFFLQKMKDARRIYAEVAYTRTNCDGFKEEGITFPSMTMQAALLKQFYEECGIPPTSLAYLEAHGTGTKVGDPVELNCIDTVLCPGRTTPLKIGSIKSNLGHTEPASGACGLAKVIIAMETGYIPPNLHHNRPREDMRALVEGRIEVVSELTPWDGGYVGVNSFGFGGANAHVLLKSNSKKKVNNGAPTDDLCRLVVVSGRTEEAVTTVLDDLESRPVDAEYVSLFHNIHSAEIPGHLYRGYTILPPRDSQDTPVRDVQYYTSAKRSIWFMFSGIGSPWAGMGATLLKIPIFLKSIQKCAAVLRPHRVDVMNILTTKDPKIFESVLNSFVGIAVVQIGLVDSLASIGIVPDRIIGHSIGELGCAYAAGCLTAEETVLTAYYQGLALEETETIHGSLATVELDRVELQSICPPDVKIVYNHSSGSSTISGPLGSMRKFVTKLQADDDIVEAKSCTNVAYLMHYGTKARQKLLISLRRVFPEAKLFNEKLLNMSATWRKWEMNSGDSFLPNYFMNNLLALSPFSFEEILCAIPISAIAIEITPTGLVQTILRKSLNEKVESISISNHETAEKLLLQEIGKMYEVGLHPQLSNLYPEVQYPASRGTPMISPLVLWEHSNEWFVHKHTIRETNDTGTRVIDITLADKMFEWLAGHIIDERNLMPATSYLVLVWETVVLIRGEMFLEVPVVFEDVRFHRAITIPKEGSIRLMIMVQKGSGRFEVSEGDTTVVTGFVSVRTNLIHLLYVSANLSTENDEAFDLSYQDIYKELRLRGYHYAGLFRGLKGASLDGTKGSVAWNDNWATFIDSMLQMKILARETRELFVPTSIQMLSINPKVHLIQSGGMPGDNKAFSVKVDKNLGIVASGGVEVRRLRGHAIGRKKLARDPVLEEFKFVVHRDRAELELKIIVRLATHIALENDIGNKIKTIELIGDANDTSLDNLTSPLIQEILRDLPLLHANINIIAPIEAFLVEKLPSTIQVLKLDQLTAQTNALLAISHGLLASKSGRTLRQLQKALKTSGFLLAREPLDAENAVLSTIESEKLDIVLEKRTDKESVFLLRKRAEPLKTVAVFQINNDEFTWLPMLQAALKSASNGENGAADQILLVSEGDSKSGLMGLVKCLRKEPGGQFIQGVLIQDQRAPKFSLKNPFYFKQLDMGLALNVLRPNELWGSYRSFPKNSISSRPVRHVQMSQLTPGDFSSLNWIEGRIQPKLLRKDIIEVYYSSINFRDVMISSGKLAADDSTVAKKVREHGLGFEFSGKDMNGHAVMGLIGSGALSNLCVCESELIWLVPENWTLEDAATVPVVYGTAYYALLMKGQMQKGDRVLIHAGSGGVGQAAITLALHVGCEVFTTVGTSQKREFMKNQFPQIDDDHIGNSRDTSFEQMIFRRTQGRGVDIVLNSLAEEKLLASVRCLAEGGRFLEIGRFDLAANNSIGMELFLKGISFHGIFLDNLFDTSSDQRTRLVGMLAEGLKNGVVKPLVRTVFEIDQSETAFRYMATGKHIGKVILKIRAENEVCSAPLFHGIPRYYCSEDGSNLIHGGLGGFGLELADWLVLRGAKKLVLTSRRGITTGYQRLRINNWKRNGVKVIIIVGKDASTHKGCENILKEAVGLGPVESIFHLAVVLEDALFGKQTVESFEESFRIKAWTTKQLNKLSRTMCPHLRQFVVFSSVSCGKGNAGQTNYGMANSVMERICEARAAENLPGLAIQWGAIGDVGLVAEMQDYDEDVVVGGTFPQKISSCLQELDGFLLQNCPVVSSSVVAGQNAGGTGAATIFKAVTNIMGMKNLKTLSLHTPLMELGLDSLMTIEIKQTVEREFGVYLTIEDIRHINFLELGKISFEQASGDESPVKLTAKADDFTGIEMMIRTLGGDHLSGDICVELVTQVEGDRPEVFVLPGIEGAHNVFHSLAKKLRYPTTCLQFQTTCMTPSSIADLADNLIPHVRVRSKRRKDFVIAGYSLGSIIAIELVRRLEYEGLNGHLVLFDGSPDYIRALINQHSNANTDHDLQFSVLSRMMDVLAPHATEKLAAELQDCNTWETKLAAFTGNLPKDRNLGYTLHEQRALCSSFYHLLKAVQAYDSSILPLLRTPITLIRPEIQSVRSMSEDYGLRSITREKVEVQYVKGNHETMLDDDFCAAAINGILIQNTCQSEKQ